MAEIVEVAKQKTDKVVSYIKKNPAMVLLGGGAVVAVLYLLNRGGSTQSADTNNVDTVETIYSDGYNNIVDNMNGVATIYSQSDVEKILNGVYDYIDSAVEDSSSDITKTITDNQTDTDKSIDDLQNQIEKLGDRESSISEYEDISKTLQSVNKTLTTFNSSVNNLTSTTSKKNTSKSTKKSTSKSSSKKVTDTYKKASYKGSSIVDGLNSIGVTSSFANRKKIAKANGITNYTGTAKQNTTLLNKLKAGALKKA